MPSLTSNAEQLVALNNPFLFTESDACNGGYIYHEEGSGIVILKGAPSCPRSRFAKYQLTFNGNIAIPTGGTVTPIAVAITVNGEPRLTSRAIYTPAAVDEYGNVTSTAIINVPRGCCFSVSVRAVAGSNDATVTPAPFINIQNGNLDINRVVRS